MRTIIVARGCLAVVGWSAIVLIDAFLLRPNPQSALVLLFLPVLQWIGCAITLLVDAVVAHNAADDATRTRKMVMKKRLLQFLLVVAMLFTGWWFFQRPSNEREWVPNLARLPRATFTDERVTIQNVRNTEYRTAEDYTVNYRERTFDLNRIQSVDFLVVPFQSAKLAAHTFLVFGFDDGERLAISVEVRREQGEAYSPLRGMLRQCELIYVIAEEREVILLRTKYRQDRVYLYPIQSSRDKIREMFLSMLQRANGLRSHPEFYNTLTNNCTSNILHHFNQVSNEKLPANLKVLFPGYSDQLVYDLGLIDSQLPFAHLRQQSEITGQANRFADDVEFSRRIRE